MTETETPVTTDAPTPGLTVEAPVGVRTKTTKRKLRRWKKSRSRRRMTPAQIARSEAMRRYWSWEEKYTAALDSLIKSLANGRRLSAKALVKLACDIADQGTALYERRRPPEAV